MCSCVYCVRVRASLEGEAEMDAFCLKEVLHNPFCIHDYAVIGLKLDLLMVF